MPLICFVGMSKYCVAPLISFSTANIRRLRLTIGARLRVAMLLLVRHAFTVHDLPKHIWIGRLRRGAMGPQSDEQALTRRRSIAH